MIEAQIQTHTAQRRAFLAQQKTVLIQLDKRGNIKWAVEPLAFGTRQEALDFQRANKHHHYSLYAGL